LKWKIDNKGDISMKLKDFLDMYSNKRGITKINDDNLGRLATGTANYLWILQVGKKWIFI